MARNEQAIWNRFSGIYDAFIKSDEAAYKDMTDRMKLILQPDAEVLEVATGTGIIALGLAGRVRRLEAVDFSAKMVAAAREKARRRGVENVRFSVQDALGLSYGDRRFDTVIISNTLHIMPEPEKALAEIQRVLKPDGRLIAPTYVHAGSSRAAVLSRLMSVTGFRAYHKWTMDTYLAFLGGAGFEIMESALLGARFPLAYVVAGPGRVKE